MKKFTVRILHIKGQKIVWVLFGFDLISRVSNVFVEQDFSNLKDGLDLFLQHNVYDFKIPFS